VTQDQLVNINVLQCSTMYKYYMHLQFFLRSRRKKNWFLDYQWHHSTLLKRHKGLHYVTTSRKNCMPEKNAEDFGLVHHFLQNKQQ